MEFNQINLTTQDHVDRRILYGLLGTLALVLSIFTVLNAVNGIQAYREKRDYQVKINELQEQVKSLSAQNGGADEVDDDAVVALQERTRRANYLIALDVYPWIAILDALESAIPNQVVLDRFVPSSDLQSIRITGFTSSVEPITQFQDALGASALFSSVILENMDLGTGTTNDQPQADKGAIHFEMMCHLDLKALLPEDVYGGLWIALASAVKGGQR
jgi:Tfp pilus assembly protein PilN